MAGALNEDLMIGRIVVVTSLILLPCVLAPAGVRAQDVPGIEICTVEKTMERRTSCLQSNVDFLQKTIAKLAADHQQKLDAANRQIEGLKGTLAGLQKTIVKLTADHQQKLDAANRQIEGLKISIAGLQKIVDDLQAAQKVAEDQKKAGDQKKADAPPVKDGGK